tara:strand:+ start:176 stop:379 length:204 start_codon:yes stop_codon:yes gene_type:complete
MISEGAGMYPDPICWADAGDRCAIVGDYYTDPEDDRRFKNLFYGCEKRKGWVDISDQVLQMFTDIDL